MKMAKMGKKANLVVCFCDTTRKGQGRNCECWDTKGNPIVKTPLIRIRKKVKERFIPSPKRFKR